MVKFIGVCLPNQCELYLILEFMARGSVKVMIVTMLLSMVIMAGCRSD